MSKTRRVALPLAVTLAVQMLVAFAVYCAPVMAPVAGPALGYAPVAFKAMYDALKPGGVLGVEEHRGRNDQPQDPLAKSGYVREDFAIAMIENAGFKLVARSEINANPKDTKDYELGVWTLPPVYTQGDKEREKYAAIGESDRFTLKFVKP